jgi:hypothetical protein
MQHLYTMAEHLLKNGMLFSSKYESRVRVFDPPHVLFMSNQRPADGAWSADRVRLIDLDAPPMHMGLAA